MGKNKWYFETENSVKQPGSANSHTSHRSKKSGSLPSPLVWESPENMPLPKLIRLVWLRLRRSWVALRFQLNRWSFGLFKKKTVLQLCVLAGTGFVLLGPDGESGILTRNNSPVSPWARETTLDVVGSDEKPARKAKSTKPKNDAAPVGAGDLLQMQSMEYIERYSKIAVGEMNQYGIPASISLAQGLIESRAGTSKLAVSNNNHFGMKCFSRNCRKGHCSNFTDDTHKDFFRKFPSAWESWRAHSQLLASGRYAKLKKYGRDYRAWANGLKSVGYATDRTYAEKLIGIIERYDLHKYDR